jgi:hypothetical protein
MSPFRARIERGSGRTRVKTLRFVESILSGSRNGPAPVHHPPDTHCRNIYAHGFSLLCWILWLPRPLATADPQKSSQRSQIRGLGERRPTISLSQSVGRDAPPARMRSNEPGSDGLFAARCFVAEST